MRTTCEQCGKTFRKPTKMQAINALRMHVGRVHGNIRNVQKHPETPKHDERRQKRLDYQREYRRRRKLESNGDHPLACFCPRCGLDLQLLATALTVVKKANR